MSGQREEFLAGRAVPQPDRVVRLPETMRVPSGLKLTLKTDEVCPVSGAKLLAGRGVPQRDRGVHKTFGYDTSLTDTMREPRRG
jgi:hypothetical protein